MILWEQKPTIVEHKIMTQLIQSVLDFVDCIDDNDESLPLYFEDDIIKMFGADNLVNHIKDILKIHTSKDVFKISMYYELILNRIFKVGIDLYNDKMSDFNDTDVIDYGKFGGKTHISESGICVTDDEIDEFHDHIEDTCIRDDDTDMEEGDLITFKQNTVFHIWDNIFFSSFFYDEDFDLPADMYTKLTDEQFSALGLREGTFQVVNRMTPHKDELKPIKIENPWSEQ